MTDPMASTLLCCLERLSYRVFHRLGAVDRYSDINVDSRDVRTVPHDSKEGTVEA
jgi:hypothetical protein